MDSKNVKRVVSLRLFRQWHKYAGLVLSTFVFISALTGILLAWKKEVNLLQPPTQQGSSIQMKEWLPVYKLDSLARMALLARDSLQTSNPIERLDIRPHKGIVKVLFKQGNLEVQIDLKSGEIRSVATRHADWIEALHDGSILGDAFKLTSMSVLGLGLIFLILSGFWLWNGPRVIRNARKYGAHSPENSK